MDNIILIDTLHVVNKYPKADIFSHIDRLVGNTSFRNLKFGIPYADIVIRSGSSGYKYSLWKGDARAYITDQVDENIGEGRGMGVWLQFGPKFLMQNQLTLQGAVKGFLNDLGIFADYETRISRLDLAIDLLGESMQSIDLTYWKNNWVGRSKLSASFNNSRTGVLETINIGKRTSAVFLRIYDKLAQAIKEGDFLFWKDIWNGFEGNVTRVEWQVRPNQGGFKGLEKFENLDGFALRELLNYLLKWGRLAKPDPDNDNRSRWVSDPFWKRIEESAENWSYGVDWAIKRIGKENHEVSEGYIRFIVGALTSGMAKLSDQKPNLYSLFEGLEKYGIRIQALNDKAEFKQGVFKRL